jgi:hypothetical protein
MREPARNTHGRGSILMDETCQENMCRAAGTEAALFLVLAARVRTTVPFCFAPGFSVVSLVNEESEIKPDSACYPFSFLGSLPFSSVLWSIFCLKRRC